MNVTYPDGQSLESLQPPPRPPSFSLTEKGRGLNFLFNVETELAHSHPRHRWGSLPCPRAPIFCLRPRLCSDELQGEFSQSVQQKSQSGINHSGSLPIIGSATFARLCCDARLSQNFVSESSLRHESNRRKTENIVNQKMKE